MDILKLHQNIISEYKEYINGFITIRNPQIKQIVEKEQSKLIPPPLIQFNPAYKNGASVDALVQDRLLNPEFKQIFKGFNLYQHQVEAIKIGNNGFIVTSGTGSGKSLTYLSTIFNHILNQEESPKGVQAILVYPMNALINSQFEDIKEYKDAYEKRTNKQFPITFNRYTGQEGQNEREKTIENPPHIILTNYMMLELILTRPKERDLREKIQNNLQFLVFDELHTYRGRQGADIALLIRRIKAMAHQTVTCIGTSATMISQGTKKEQQEAVAEIAGKIFGQTFTNGQIILETLQPSLDSSQEISLKELQQAINNGINENGSIEQLKQSPFAKWIEQNIAIQEASDQRLVRRKPKTIPEIAQQLHEYTSIPLDHCQAQTENLIKWINNINKNLGRKAILPFKLHQFISQTGTVYATLHQDQERTITLEPGRFLNNEKVPLFPLAFSKESGEEFICVLKNTNTSTLEPREFEDISLPEITPDLISGYIIPNSPNLWTTENIENLPKAWKISNGKKLDKDHRDRVPTPIYYDHKGNYSDKKNKKFPFRGWFMPTKLLLDPTSGTIFHHQKQERNKLTKLGNEGRSTSTTILSFSSIKELRKAGLKPEKQKILSFSDNRQDAALQAGHFNDFINTIRLRSAIYNASLKTTEKLTYKNLGQEIRKYLDLSISEYTKSGTEETSDYQKRKLNKTFETYLLYRAIDDLRRGWKDILPNLEQTALLKIEYLDIHQLAKDQTVWKNSILEEGFSVQERTELIYNTLDFFRKEYAIFSQNPLGFRTMEDNAKDIEADLKAPWKFDTNEEIKAPFTISILPPKNPKVAKPLGPTSAFGRFFKKSIRLNELKKEEYQETLGQFLTILEREQFLESKQIKGKNGKSIPSWQLKLGKICWTLGDGKTKIPDPIKTAKYAENAPAQKPNKYFQNIYKLPTTELRNIAGFEHTGQLSTDLRIEREQAFREGSLQALFCSPTMELGVNIGTLDLVHMRNVPPNPANYAQRSGRAGRSGNTALIFTYCAGLSPHDRHYFKNRVDMVAGNVKPPRLDLENHELIETHLNALILSKLNLKELKNSIADLIELEDESLPLKETIKTKTTISKPKPIKALFERVVKNIKLPSTITDKWILNQIKNCHISLNQTINRWRTLYKSAEKQADEASKELNKGILKKSSSKYKTLKRTETQARAQKFTLLNNTPSKYYSEFYPYRYLASEGFLPGYNFTRLPLRVFVMRDSQDGEYISRPRKIALAEFGPRNLIYHNGAKYRISKIVSTEIETKKKRATIVESSGYYIQNKPNNTINNCPLTKEDLTGNCKQIHSLVPMAESHAIKTTRITCQEEERVREGFAIETYFAFPDDNDKDVKTATLSLQGNPLLKIKYIPTAKIISVNNKWKRAQKEMFPIGMSYGYWKTEKEIDAYDPSDTSKEKIQRIQLFTNTTANALYIFPTPVLGLDREGVITLQYALKRAIENVFQVETNEMAVETMGDEQKPNLFIYEAAEGSLGILSEFFNDPNRFNEVITEAIKICNFDDPEYQKPASYDDLLSYYNQRHHNEIDRFLIKDALNRLQRTKLHIENKPHIEHKTSTSYDLQYQQLQEARDQNSSTEDRFLRFLYKNKLRLPDKAQPLATNIYCQPDFFYHPNIYVFCDGTPHDKPQVQERDELQREALEEQGYELVIYYYKDDLPQLIKENSHIFTKAIQD